MNKTNTFRSFAILAVSMIGLIGFAESASANTKADLHPRRAEVNLRLHRQALRISHKVAAGTMSTARAARLHYWDRAIRREERTMAALNHGHITKAEKQALNQQENQVSRRIVK